MSLGRCEKPHAPAKRKTRVAKPMDSSQVLALVGETEAAEQVRYVCWTCVSVYVCAFCLNGGIERHTGRESKTKCPAVLGGWACEPACRTQFRFIALNNRIPRNRLPLAPWRT